MPPGLLFVRSLSGDPLNVFVHNHWDTSDPYLPIAGGDSRAWLVSVDEHFDLTTLSIQGTPGGRQSVATLVIGTAQRYTGDCHIQIQGLLTQM